MKNAPLEADLLSIFRLFLGIQFGYFEFNVLAHIHLGQITRCPLCVMAAGAEILLLCGYLSWPFLQKRLGRFYFPLALILATFISLLIQNELLQNVSDPRQFIYDEGAWQIFLFLFFPLILIAWQYNFRVVILYSFFSAGLESIMLHLGGYGWAFEEVFYQRLMLTRSLVFLVAGYVISIIMSRQRQQRQALIEANRQLRHYAVTLEQLAVTQERNRMSRELHDTLAHTLSGLAVQLEAVRSLWQSTPERSYTMLEESLQATRTGLTESRKAIQALRASPLEDLGLTLALRNLAESAASRSGATLNLEIPANLEKLPPDVEQCLYRVAQEALENIVRHAEAQHITLRLAREDTRLDLSIRDDGLGFDPAQVDVQKHFGLKGLHERVAMLGGDLQIHSQPGQGTTIHLTLEQAP